MAPRVAGQGERLLLTPTLFVEAFRMKKVGPILRTVQLEESTAGRKKV